VTQFGLCFHGSIQEVYIVQVDTILNGPVSIVSHVQKDVNGMAPKICTNFSNSPSSDGFSVTKSRL